MAELTEQQLKDAGMAPEKIKELMAQAKNRIRDVGDQITDSFSVLEKVQDWMDGAGKKLDDLGNVSGAAAVEFGLLAAGIAGARKEAGNFLSGLDAGRLGSFTESAKSLLDVIRTSPGGALAISAAERLKSMLANMGVAASDISNAAAKGTGAVASLAEKIMTGADNSLRFGSAMMDAAAKGGNLAQLMDGDVSGAFAGVGANLENLTEVTSHFHNIMHAAATETGTQSVEEMNKFVGALLKTPEGMNAMIKGVDIAGSHLDGLTAILRLADGANLDRMQTMTDMHEIESQFGMDTTDSIKLMSRVVDVSKDLGAQQGDVRDAILKTTGAFNLYGVSGDKAAKMNQGLTDSVKNWASSLERAGIPAHNALALAGKYTTQLKEMSEAQEALVSQQTGGPGGLLGALQFEDLQRTDPAAAAAKVQETIKSMLPGGQMISKTDSVKGGEEGASQFILQRKILMDGLAGIKAGSKEEADAMIAAMLAGKAIPSGKTTEQTLAETMEIGKKKEDLTQSFIREANIDAQYVTLQAGDINAGTLQRTLGGGSAQGSDDTGRGINIASQEMLERRRKDISGTDHTTGLSQITTSLGGIARDFLPHLNAIGTSGKRQVTKDSTSVALPPKSSLPQVSSTAKQTAMSQGESGATEYLAQREMLMSTGQAKSAEDADAMIEALRNKTSLDTNTDSNTFGDMVPAGGQVRQSAVAASRTPDAGAGADTRSTRGGAPGLTAGHTGGPIPVTLSGSALTVNVTATCPHCGKDSHRSGQAGVVSQASQATGK